MAGIRKTVHGRESFPPMHGIPQPHSGRPVNGLFGPNDIGAERVEARIDVLITAVNLLHILDDAAPLRTQGGDKERYPGTDVGRSHHRTAQAAFVVVPDDRGPVRVAEDYLRPHVYQFVHEKEAAFKHLLVDEHRTLRLRRRHEEDRKQGASAMVIIEPSRNVSIS